MPNVDTVLLRSRRRHYRIPCAAGALGGFAAELPAFVNSSDGPPNCANVRTVKTPRK
jgi:hypothetical protein